MLDVSLWMNDGVGGSLVGFHWWHFPFLSCDNNLDLLCKRDGNTSSYTTFHMFSPDTFLEQSDHSVYGLGIVSSMGRLLPSKLRVPRGPIRMRFPFTLVIVYVLSSVATAHDRIGYNQPVLTTAPVGFRFRHFLAPGFELYPGSAPPISVPMVE